ncbi:MAG: DUF2085 domain-containing protein [Gemmatimonadaceae bacterium]
MWTHYWGCHRLPSRSFAVGGRQFHLCARCTGLSVGIILSLALIPFRGMLTPFALGFLALASADALTQYAGWRESTNELRFLTGLSTGATLLPLALRWGGI